MLHLFLVIKYVIDKVNDKCECKSFEVNKQVLHHSLNSKNSKEDDSQIENNPSGQYPSERSDKTTEQVFLRLSTRAQNSPDRLMHK